MLLAWGGVAALAAPRRRAAWHWLAAALSLAIVAGVLVSDALLYHSSNLAPTARYHELASLNSRFAGRGPTLFTDFDEYAMYELRDLDIGGPNFVYPPAALARAAGGYGDPVDLNRMAPGALRAYPLIVTRREPGAVRPSSAYRLLWQGSYYRVWERRAHAPPIVEHVALSGSPSRQCARIGVLAGHARTRGARLIAAEAPATVEVSLARAVHPRGWGHQRGGVVMRTPGRLTAGFVLPSAGVWNLWVQGQLMPAVRVDVDARRLSTIAGALSGNSLVPNTVPPIPVKLTAGTHRLSVIRSGGFSLRPGEGGSAVLDAVVLTPGQERPTPTLRIAAPAAWRALCGGDYQWVELTGSIGART